MPTERIVTNARSLKVLLRDVETGRFAIPKLQREFVWDGPKAAKLFDSIYRGMPVGLLLIWETSKANRLIVRQNHHVLPLFQDRHKKVWFVIDGQQRISVLHHTQQGSHRQNARKRDIFFDRVVLSLENGKDEQQIVYRKPVSRQFVSLCEILHPSWRAKLGYLTQKQLKKVRECRESILNYKVHYMFLHLDVGEIKECFLRVNTQGMKITTADAIFSRVQDFDLRDSLHEIRAPLRDGFDSIDEVPILWALACTRDLVNPKGTEIDHAIQHIEREIREKNQTKALWDSRLSSLKHSFGKAVDYLHQYFKVLNHGLLYSDYMVSMLALFFFWNGAYPNGYQKEEIKKWFWATNVGSRYSGREFLRCIKEDATFFQKLAKKKNDKFSYRPETDLREIRRAQYSGHTGIASAFYSLLLMNKPVSLREEGITPIPLDRFCSAIANRKDRHHIFPRRLLREDGIPVSRYNSICNICLLTAEENQKIGMKRPDSYLAKVRRKRNFASRMAHHLIPHQEDSGLWLWNISKGFSQFLKAREAMIAKAMEREAGIKLFRREQ